MPTRVLIALGPQMYRDGLRHALSSWDGIEVVAEAGDGRSAVSLAKELRPDIVIVESVLPALAGAEVTRQIVEECPGVSVIAVAIDADREVITRSMGAGASAYVLADGGLTELQLAIAALMEGKVYLSPAAEAAVITSWGDPGGSGASRLTAREHEVLQLLAEGKPTKQIADVLCVSVKTVETHRRQLMKKLGIHSVAGLTKFAIRHGITSVND